MEGCGMGCIKYLLFIFNFFFAIAGIGIIVAGGLVLRYADYNLLEGNTQGPPIALIVVGSIIFITAFLGCCGAIKENYCMLISFAVVLIIIFIAQLAIGIVAAVSKDTVKGELHKQLNQSIAEYNNDDFTREAWDEVQTDFKCCGINGPEDWKFAKHVPSSCCGDYGKDSHPAHQICEISRVVYTEGCYEKLAMLLRDGLVVTMGVGIGVAFIELAGAILACFLAKNIQRGKEEA